MVTQAHAPMYSTSPSIQTPTLTPNPLPTTVVTTVTAPKSILTSSTPTSTPTVTPLPLQQHKQSQPQQPQSQSQPPQSQQQHPQQHVQLQHQQQIPQQHVQSPSAAANVTAAALAAAAASASLAQSPVHPNVMAAVPTLGASALSQALPAGISASTMAPPPGAASHVPPAAAAMQPMAAAAAAAAAFGQYPTGMMFASPETAIMEDQPTYVNPKQYARILKRRESRKKQTGTDVTSYTPRKRSYMHESRHKHAMQRRRGPGGRFLSKEEQANAPKETVAAGQ